MEQTTQQIIQKPSLPIKTKIAIWWLIFVGGLTIMEGIIFYPGGPTLGREGVEVLFIFGSVLSIFLFFMIPSFLLLIRKRVAWWLCIIIILINLIFALFCLVKTHSTLQFDTFSFGLSSFKSIPRLLPEYLISHKSVFFGHNIYVNGFEFVFYTIPFVLLLLDRKKFFKIAS